MAFNEFLRKKSIETKSIHFFSFLNSSSTLTCTTIPYIENTFYIVPWQSRFVGMLIFFFHLVTFYSRKGNHVVHNKFPLPPEKLGLGCTEIQLYIGSSKTSYKTTLSKQFYFLKHDINMSSLVTWLIWTYFFVYITHIYKWLWHKF